MRDTLQLTQPAALRLEYPSRTDGLGHVLLLIDSASDCSCDEGRRIAVLERRLVGEKYSLGETYGREHKQLEVAHPVV